MGNKGSGSASDPGSDSADPITLDARDLASVAKYIKSGKCKNIYLMVGSGLSTAAGIPDFRSPKTGLYANLAKFNLPYAEAIFEISFFRDNPAPFYAFSKALDPHHFRPTLGHAFIRLLETHGLLRLCFTQNIDGLERKAHITPARLVEAHGSFATQHCIDCHAPFDDDEMKRRITAGRVTHCARARCGGLVKPDIVFFGESLPESFHTSIPALRGADLLIIMGTSLKVYPFAMLANYVPARCPRVLINLEEAGDIGERSDDVLCLGKCDEVVRELCRLLGWEEELDKEWATTEVAGKDKGADEIPTAEDGIGETKLQKKSEEERLKDEVDRLASEVERALAVADNAGEAEAGEKDQDRLLTSKDGEELGYQRPPKDKSAEGVSKAAADP